MKVAISSVALHRIRVETAAAPGVEVCGLLFGEPGLIAEARPCANVAADPATAFELDPRALVAAHRAMRTAGPRLIGHYHTHPTGRSVPSPRDAAAAAPDGMIWLIAAGDALTAWRAVAEGAVEGRFAPLQLERVGSGCADDGAPPEGLPLRYMGRERQR
ncbi:MAG: M67 family metallopeptidase [Sphingomonas sp.]